MAAINSDALKSRAVNAYKAFTPAQRVLAGLMTVVALVGGLYFYRWVSAPSYAVLASGMSGQDASDVTAKLQADKVPYKLSSGGSTVLVPQQKLDAERLSLSAAGLPKGGHDGWSLMDKQGLTTSTFQQQVDYQRALEGEIASTLEQIDGVNKAEVHLVLPEERLFTDEESQARASVLLQTAQTLSSSQVRSVVSLVSSAVKDLDPAAVTVTDSDGRLLSSSGSADGDAQQQQQAVEDSLSARAQTMLDKLLGPGHAVVRVTGDIDTAAHQTDTETYNPDKTTPLSKATTSETYGGTASPPAAGPLTTSNTTTAETTPDAGSGNYNKTTDTTQYGATRTVDHTTQPAGQIKRLSVAVALDSGAKNAPPVEQVQQLVGAAVGADTARGDSVVVTSTAFDSEAAAAATPAKKASPAGGLLGSDKGKTLSTGVAALVLLLVAFILARSLRRPKVTPLEVSGDGLAELLPGTTPLALPPGGAGAAALPAGELSPADLLNAVEAQPDDVANLLRNWLADAGTSR